MPARIALDAVLPDLLSGMGLGFCLGLLRSLLPGGRASRMGFWIDFFAAGAALLLIQSYAARSAAAGELRWYLLAALLTGAAAAHSLFAGRLAAARRRLYKPLRQGRSRLKSAMFAVRCRIPAGEPKKRRKNVRKKQKKQLQTGQRVLYNSNVS